MQSSGCGGDASDRTGDEDKEQSKDIAIKPADGHKRKRAAKTGRDKATKKSTGAKDKAQRPKGKGNQRRVLTLSNWQEQDVPDTAVAHDEAAAHRVLPVAERDFSHTRATTNKEAKTNLSQYSNYQFTFDPSTLNGPNGPTAIHKSTSEKPTAASPSTVAQPTFQYRFPIHDNRRDIPNTIVTGDKGKSREIPPPPRLEPRSLYSFSPYDMSQGREIPRRASVGGSSTNDYTPNDTYRSFTRYPRHEDQDRHPEIGTDPYTLRRSPSMWSRPAMNAHHYSVLHAQQPDAPREDPYAPYGQDTRDSHDFDSGRSWSWNRLHPVFDFERGVPYASVEDD
jgi:hypothetical protein